jgi:hypothetical protein
MNNAAAGVGFVLAKETALKTPGVSKLNIISADSAANAALSMKKVLPSYRIKSSSSVKAKERANLYAKAIPALEKFSARISYLEPFLSK